VIKGRFVRWAAAAVIGLATVVVLPATDALAATPTCVMERDYHKMKIPSAVNSNPVCYLRQGNRGDGVMALQKALLLCNIYDRPIVVDGIFGSETYGALRYAQRVEGIGVDGIYGKETLSNIWFPARGGGCRNASGQQRGYVDN
jgi:hypothetical protein